MSSGARIALALPMIGALLLAPGAADAKKTKKSPLVSIASASSATNFDGQVVTVTATCPRGRLAVGGGYDSQSASDASGGVTDLNFVYESRRQDDRSWMVSAVREDTASPGPSLNLTTTAHCRLGTPAVKKSGAASTSKKKRKLRIQEVSASGVASGNGAHGDATATCPSKTQAIGGGFSSTPIPSLTTPITYPIFTSNYRLGSTGWFVAASNIGGAAHTMTSYAYCASSLKLTERLGSVTLGGAVGGSTPTAAATSPVCGKGKVLLGGGYDAPVISPGSAFAIPISSAASGRAWRFSATNLSFAAGTLNAIGYCS